MSPRAKARIRIGLLLFVTTLVQTTIGSDLRVAQIAPDLWILMAISAGLVGGAESGAWVGFLAGLAADMFLTSTPVGLSALSYCLVGAGVGALRTGVLQERRLLVPLAGLLGTGAAVLIFVALGDMLGQTQLLHAGRSWLIRVIFIESLWNAVLALPFVLIYAWASRGSPGTEGLGSSGRSMLRGPRVVIK